MNCDSVASDRLTEFIWKQQLYNTKPIIRPFLLQLTVYLASYKAHTLTHTTDKNVPPNIRWARNTKYSLLNIQNLWNRIASRIVNSPISHTILITFHRLHTERQNTNSWKSNENGRHGRGRLFLRLISAESHLIRLYSHLCAWYCDRTAEQRWQEGFVCFKLIGESSPRCRRRPSA